MTDRIADVWGERTPYSGEGAWPRRVDQFLSVEPSQVDRWVQSACVLCSNGCGMDVAVSHGRIVGVRGRADDRVNHGRLGPKGLFGWQANNSTDRLTRPLVRSGGELHETDWDAAMSLVCERSKQVMGEHGPLSMAFYTSGQLFAEEYYTQCVVARAGIGTPHLDGNTRLCTATAEWALVESFGSDGDPGSYRDIDACDTLLLVGHNVAETQTVLWMRMLDRLEGLSRPRLVVIDPRRTPVAQQADVHLAIRPGTNVAVLNALLHELIRNDWVDHDWVEAHTVGYDDLRDIVAGYPPAAVAETCGISAVDIINAAQIIGTAQRLVSTVLQGVYQSHQATAAAVQVNNINLLRGMIGRPGCTVFQMNGQPTAENTRETGANGSLPAYRNWQNDVHVAELAAAWNVDILQIPHWAPPTHAMEIFRQCEAGSIRFLWVTATNPLVSLPELHRIRSITEQERLFLVVSDAFLTETAQVADVVLPAAIWGEKTGCFTNADRTVHLSEKAIDPPGDARSDLDILRDYARRMDFRDRNGAPLVKWSTPEEAWNAFTQVTRGRPCDQTALTYDKLRGGSGVQWPCTDTSPDGTERLYTDCVFPTEPDYCESYGHDVNTGAENEPDEYRAHNPAGRAILKAAEYVPPHEPVDDEYPLQLTTGRTAYHWHTRTKTRRAPQLDSAAPQMWVELSREDAAGLGIAEGDLVRVESRRGAIEAPARVTGSRQGVVFAPFHYGYWDQPGGNRPDGSPTAANEVTRTEWDPVSKQPVYKVTAVRALRVAAGDGRAAPAPTTTAAAPVAGIGAETRGGADAEATSQLLGSRE
jgi:anaerobic selenocysteine-containing dehydrogenase